MKAIPQPHLPSPGWASRISLFIIAWSMTWDSSLLVPGARHAGQKEVNKMYLYDTAKGKWLHRVRGTVARWCMYISQIYGVPSTLRILRTWLCSLNYAEVTTDLAIGVDSSSIHWACDAYNKDCPIFGLKAGAPYGGNHTTMLQTCHFLKTRYTLVQVPRKGRTWDIHRSTVREYCAEVGTWACRAT